MMMKRIKLNKSAPPPYWRRAKCGVVDVCNNHAKRLIKDGDAVLVKDLGYIKGKFAPMKFGTRVRWMGLNWKVINSYKDYDDMEPYTEIEVIDILPEKAFGDKTVNYTERIFIVRASDAKRIGSKKLKK
jgi:hypothetical protein